MERFNRFQSKLVAGAATLALVSFSLVAAAKLTRAGDGTAGFRATGPGGLNIDGKTSEVDVADDGTTVTVTVKLGNLDTGMSLRNKHTKEDLEADTYPTATLKVPRASLKIGGEGDAKGQMTIHGVTKEVSFHYVHSGDQVKGSTKITVGDYNVKPRSYLGVSIKPEVEVYAKFGFKDN